MNKTVIEKAKQVQIDFGNRLSLARTSRGHTQKTLAEAIGVTQGLISKIERGDQTTSAHNIAFAAELRVNTMWLNSGTGEMNDVDNVTFDSFLTECYLFTFKNTQKLNLSNHEMTVIVEGLYNAGQLNGVINLEVFRPLLKLVSHKI